MVKDGHDAITRRLNHHAGVGAHGRLEDVAEMVRERGVRSDRLVREPAAIADHVGHEDRTRLKRRPLHHIAGTSHHPMSGWG